ncbi:hypothetical protein GCM10025865_11590 [Paraoerskovia sediminicola]|uniref:Phosphatidylglycerol lysyltransferase C-terminal domain-containing protein n=1 Tax=Paraoerskovia sediminicola TaxID=1138587 RepID=A0ABM8G1C7_9CELL|nr:DUF2156 domain-containing protein [Paraoerskovia sediminicola]BDZ41860.1 hypothetical protein GCM10025865_11590 [Paraoerskovia sediminicola]
MSTPPPTSTPAAPTAAAAAGADTAPPGPRAARARTALGFLLTIPFTLSVVTVMLVLGVATTALWSPFEDSALFPHLAYGVPSFEAGRWWTPVTGSFFALVPWQYVPVAGGFLLLVGFAERRLGTSRTAVVAVACQLLGVLVTAGVVAAGATTTWTWATEAATQLDAGFSAGAVGALTVAAATLRRSWRDRIWIVTGLYVVLSTVFLGSLADVEHLVAFAAGLAVGPWLVGRPAALRLHRTTRRELRSLASGFFVVSAVILLLASLSAPATGPLGEFGGQSLATNAPAIVLDLVIAVGLRHGRRTWWRVAMVLSGLGVVLNALALLLVLAALDGDGAPLAALGLLLDVGAVVILLAGRRGFRNRRRSGISTPPGAVAPSRESARELLTSLGSPSRLSWMSTWEENSWWSPATPLGVVTYQSYLGTAIGLGDPVAGSPDDRASLAVAFMEAADDAGLTPAFFSAGPELATVADVYGWTRVQVAEEAVIDLPDLEFRGKKWQDVRTALNKGKKLGITHRMVTLADEPREIRAQVRAISDAWVTEGGLPEMGFTLGGVDEALDPAVRVGLAVGEDGTVHGVTSWLPVHGVDGRVTGWTLDLMRRRPDDSFRNTMEFLIASACVQLKEEGYLEVSLSGAPLAGGHEDDGSATAIDAVLRTVADTLEPLYGFQSLHSFKAKFQPRGEPLYLVARDEAALPKIALGLGRAYLPDARMRDLVAAVRQSRG